jgi:predicted small lipoprotein YifL
MMRKFFVVVLIAGLAASLGACGRKDKPEPPPGSDYPRQYPGW